MENMASPAALWDGFLEKQDEPQYMRNVISGLSGIMLLFSSAFFICACVVATIENAGFNVVLTGSLLFAWELGTIWLMKIGPRPMSHGFLIGVSLVMFFLVIMTAIYWGQLADCDSDYDGDYTQYSCSHQSAMRGVAAFASMIWVVQFPYMYLIVRHRGTITKDTTYGNGMAAGVEGYDYGDGYEGWGKGDGVSDPMQGTIPGESSDL